MNNNYIGVDLDLFRQPNVQRLELKLGKAGVALYIQLCLKLAEQEGKISIEDLPILSREFFIKEETIKQVLEFDNLFVFKDNHFICEWVSVRVLASKEKSKKARKAILSRWKNKGSNTSVYTSVLQTNNGSNTIKENKIKVKESKLNLNKEIIKEFFAKENLQEIIEEKLVAYENQIWWDKQASITLEKIETDMIAYFTKQKARQIKDMKATFINWILKINRNQFYKYPEKQFTPSTTSYKLPERENTNSDLVDIYQDENETLDEFELRVSERESLTGNNYRKHYTTEAGANNDYLAMKQQLIAKMSYD
jgi:hypothetical protein